MGELKPCPFCGSTKVHVICFKQRGAFFTWNAEINCECGVNMSFRAVRAAWATEALTRAWNRRAGNG